MGRHNTILHHWATPRRRRQGGMNSSQTHLPQLSVDMHKDCQGRDHARSNDFYLTMDIVLCRMLVMGTLHSISQMKWQRCTSHAEFTMVISQVQASVGSCCIYLSLSRVFLSCVREDSNTKTTTARARLQFKNPS